MAAMIPDVTNARVNLGKKKMNLTQAIRIASDKATYSNHTHRLGAILIGAPIWSGGFNRVFMHGASLSSIHAEDAATRKYQGQELVVVRLGRSGMLRCSKPCEACQKLLKKRGIKKVYYVNWDGEIEKLCL